MGPGMVECPCGRGFAAGAATAHVLERHTAQFGSVLGEADKWACGECHFVGYSLDQLFEHAHSCRHDFASLRGPATDPVQTAVLALLKEISSWATAPTPAPSAAPSTAPSSAVSSALSHRSQASHASQQPNALQLTPVTPVPTLFNPARPPVGPRQTISDRLSQAVQLASPAAEHAASLPKPSMPPPRPPPSQPLATAASSEEEQPSEASAPSTAPKRRLPTRRAETAGPTPPKPVKAEPRPAKAPKTEARPLKAEKVDVTLKLETTMGPSESRSLPTAKEPRAASTASVSVAETSMDLSGNSRSLLDISKVSSVAAGEAGGSSAGGGAGRGKSPLEVAEWEGRIQADGKAALSPPAVWVSAAKAFPWLVKARGEPGGVLKNVARCGLSLDQAAFLCFKADLAEEERLTDVFVRNFLHLAARIQERALQPELLPGPDAGVSDLRGLAKRLAESGEAGKFSLTAFTTLLGSHAHYPRDAQRRLALLLRAYGLARQDFARS